MSLRRLAYRASQLLNALRTPPDAVAMEEICPYLSPTQITLFYRMQPSEQAHARSVLERLKSTGQTDPDLLAAALLHDIGKILYPLSLWERVVIVLGKRFFPRATEGWGKGSPRGLRRPFVVAVQHAGWGADLAERAGVSARGVELIRRHDELLPAEPHSGIDLLLAKLQEADSTS